MMHTSFDNKNALKVQDKLLAGGDLMSNLRCDQKFCFLFEFLTVLF